MGRQAQFLNPLFGKSYIATILGLSPIAYWPLDETSGTTAVCRVNSAQNATYTGVTLANGTGPDGGPCPFFDGTNDYVNIYSAALNTAFSGAAGTLSIWAKVNAAGVWTDATTRLMMRLWVDANNEIYVRKPTTNDTVSFRYEAGATVEDGGISGQTATTWQQYLMTWSKADEEVKYYLGTVQQGPTDTALGTWAGNLGNTRTLIGANTTTPGNPWHGWLAHGILWDRVLTSTERAVLAAL